MPRIRPIITEEINSDGQFVPPNPYGQEVSIGREMEGGDDQDMQRDLQADIGSQPIKAIDESTINTTVGFTVIKAVVEKLGEHGIPKLIGEGEDGLAYILGNKIYKLTKSVSEVNDSIKIKGKRNAHLADVYGVYGIDEPNINNSSSYHASSLGKGLYIIVLERLKIEQKKIALLEDSTIQILSDILGVTPKHYQNWVRVLETYKQSPQLYQKTMADKITVGFANHPQEKYYLDSLLRIVDELKANGITSMDLVYLNLGYKQNGNLAFFDLGKGNENGTPNADKLKLENNDIDESFEDMEELLKNNSLTIEQFATNIAQKLGYQVKEIMGTGSQGYACDLGNDIILKVTSDRTEASEALKLLGQNNTYIGNFYKVFNFEKPYDGIYAILREKLDVDEDRFEKMWNQFRVFYQNHGMNSEDIRQIIKFNNSESMKLLEKVEEFAKREQRITTVLPFINMIKELVEKKIRSVDFMSSNFGFKKNGNLAYYDIGYSTTEAQPEFDILKLENQIFERVLTYMPNAKAVTVKKKCRLGGNGDGTSTACNQGDINNIELGDISEDKFYRVDYDFTHDRGTTALDVINHEGDVGNEDVRNQALNTAKQNGIDLSKVNANDIVWVTKTPQDAARYDSENPNSIENVGEVIIHKPLILTQDGDGGYLILKMEKLQQINEGISEGLNEGIKAYHGSPNKFDQFSIDKVGSSDGREVGGWGLYFTNDYNVAKQYATNSGSVIQVDLTNGKYLNLDEGIDDELANDIITRGLRKGISQKDIEQFQNDFYDEQYRYDTTNKQVYEWLAAVLGGNRQASEYLASTGFIGIIFHDKTTPEAINYVIFDPRNARIVSIDDDNEDYQNENVQLLDKNLLKTNKITPEEKDMIMNITHGDNYTYFIASAYAFLWARDGDTNRSKNLNDPNVKNALRGYYQDVRNYDPNVFPIEGYDVYLKNIHIIDMLESLSARRYCIQMLSGIPQIYLRNLRGDMRIPRDAQNIKYGLEPTIKDIKGGLKKVENLSPEKQELYYKKIFSSEFTTFDVVKKQLEKLEILFLNHDEGIDEVRQKIKYSQQHGDAKIIYDKKNIVVADVLTSDGMKELGCGSTWCFATESGTHYWSDYANDSHVNLVFNFNLQPDDKNRMVVVLPTGEEYNMYNEFIGDEQYTDSIGISAILNSHKARPKIRRKPEMAFHEAGLYEGIKRTINEVLVNDFSYIPENKEINVNSLPFKIEIEQSGGKIYSVGGAVRDAMLNKPSKDLDLLITGLPLDKLEQILSKYGRVDNVGKSFGIIKFNTPETGELDIAIPRTEKATGQGGYQGFEVTSDHSLPIEKDLERRDFTINAIAKDANGNLIDPYHGQEDIKNKVIRMVNPQAFKDDPLRMIRAVQFAARFGFTIESETMKAIQQNANRIIEISPERILIEFDKIVKKGNPVIAAQLLEETGLFSYIFGNNPDEGVRINYEELKKAKTMGEFIYILAQGNTSFDSPSAFYKDKLKGDLDTYNEIRALEVAFKSGGYSTSIHVRLEIFKMYKLYPNSLNSPIIPQMVKDNIHKMKGSGMPFSMKELQINGNDLLAMGYTGIQIGELLKNLILDIYSGKLSNNRELLLKHLTPKEPNIEKSKL